ncbi:serine/threonine-protein kinase [Corallococcus llansteffanensis]|uniref:Serine/threonine protein kinase n=1 Tax=Corallococcus llansteffanensis TaxID=2316731 RepID=A0A3A8NUF6_9BACT|nr:serine/threonine-protein kinase [Corallococcus llansteffanensis]RKH44785.1 serine/threonine protein kinase [Corallococcus llansteffanensis]
MERRGGGAYGAVYRAFAEGHPGPVALKLALYPGDERFAREVELLSRLRHPHVPRLLGHGHWLPPGGPPHPFLAMEYVEGVSLYAWARRQRPSSRQVLHVLAELARALEATHAVGGIHRDVKGDNVLVSAAEGRAFLTDFGSGHFVGAAPLTSPPFPPGTPPYRSPEAWRSVRFPLLESAVPYAPGTADDVFALGVTAYRLVTGEYPPAAAPKDPECPVWSLEGAGPRPPRALNVRCCPELSGLVSRMLSVRPEARGGARELAEALEQTARKAGPEADAPLFIAEVSPPLRTWADSRPVLPRGTRPRWRPWLVAGSVGGALMLGAGGMLRVHPGAASAKEPTSLRMGAEDGGTVAVGDSVMTTPVAPTREPSAWSTIGVDMPPKPFPGQRRPDANGRCPGKAQVAIHGGCWMKSPVDPKDCDPDSFVYKGVCYTPVFALPRPATSNKAAP